jgi:hyaluronan synthase
VVSLYILSRFALAYFYEPDPTWLDSRYEPTISFGIPAKNEAANIKETILRIAATDYPKHKFDIIAVNDGSTDRTLHEMMAAQQAAAARGVNVRIINWQHNKLKSDG